MDDHNQNALSRMSPHPRTLRKARMQVQCMVADKLSAAKIRRYLHRWACWWANTVQSWEHHELLQWFLNVCWDVTTADYAVGLLHTRVREACNDSHSEYAAAIAV